MPRSKSAGRLQKLLLIVPYVVAHPGVRLEELGRLFDVREQDLTRDLTALFLTGLPPYTPGDLVDVRIEDGRVWISMADHFARPIRLTRTEALALVLKGKALLAASPVEADALESALGKMEAHLDPELVVEVASVEEETPHLPAIRAAVRDRERLEIDYYSASRDEIGTRQIDPEHLFTAMGNWYVVAWCHTANGERFFRVDRVRDARPTGDTFEPRGLEGPGRPLYSRTGEEVEVRLRLAGPARWVAEYYEVDEAAERDGTLEVLLPASDLAWAAKLVLRLGDDVEVLAPAELAGLARRAAERTLVLYR